MPRKTNWRKVHQSILQSDRIDEVSDQAMSLMQSLVVENDQFGVIQVGAKHIKKSIGLYTLRESYSLQTIPKYLQELVDARLIRRYRTTLQPGKEYAMIYNAYECQAPISGGKRVSEWPMFHPDHSEWIDDNGLEFPHIHLYSPDQKYIGNRKETERRQKGNGSATTRKDNGRKAGGSGSGGGVSGKDNGNRRETDRKENGRKPPETVSETAGNGQRREEKRREEKIPPTPPISPLDESVMHSIDRNESLRENLEDEPGVVPFEWVRERWNSLLSNTTTPVRSQDTSWHRLFQSRWKENKKKSFWQWYFHKIRSTPKLTTENKMNLPITLKWTLKQTNFNDILSGRYDEQESQSKYSLHPDLIALTQWASRNWLIFNHSATDDRLMIEATDGLPERLVKMGCALWCAEYARREKTGSVGQNDAKPDFYLMLSVTQPFFEAYKPQLLRDKQELKATRKKQAQNKANVKEREKLIELLISGKTKELIKETGNE